MVEFLSPHCGTRLSVQTLFLLITNSTVARMGVESVCDSKLEANLDSTFIRLSRREIKRISSLLVVKDNLAIMTYLQRNKLSPVIVLTQIHTFLQLPTSQITST